MGLNHRSATRALLILQCSGTAAAPFQVTRTAQYPSVATKKGAPKDALS